MTTTKPTPPPQSRPSPTPRTAPDEQPDTRPQEQPVEASKGKRSRKPGRRATVLACLTAAAVLLGAAATWFAFEASGLRAGDPEANAALVDAEATAEVTKEVSAAVESVFSYNYASLDRTRRAAERVLLDDALRQYNAKFAAVSEAAKKRELVRTASVRAIGVRTLHGDTARLLVFLDQQTLTSNGDGRKQTTVYLEVVAEKAGGEWKIAQLGGR